MPNGEVQNAPEIEEATDQLGAPDSQEENDDDWSLDDLSPEQRQQYERGVAAVDEFLADKRTTQYKQTDSNREKMLGYLDEHDLPMSFGGLYVAFEQLSEANELELKAVPQEEQEEASAASEETEPAPTPTPQPPQKRVVGWRNGKQIEVGA